MSKALLAKIIQMNNSDVINSMNFSHLVIHQNAVTGRVVGNMLHTERGMVDLDVGKITNITVAPVELDVPFDPGMVSGGETVGPFSEIVDPTVEVSEPTVNSTESMEPATSAEPEPSEETEPFAGSPEIEKETF